VPVREKLESVAADCQRVSFLVGPEGDFAKQEIEGALAAGFEPVSLGEIVLRVETAGLFLASAARYRFG
jgi:16S rRNA (uracil1498-N3)-methyltransferase